MPMFHPCDKKQAQTKIDKGLLVVCYDLRLALARFVPHAGK